MYYLKKEILAHFKEKPKMALYSLKRGILAHNIKLKIFEYFSKTEIVNQFTQKRQKQKLETEIFHLKKKFLYYYLKKVLHTIADQKTSVSFCL